MEEKQEREFANHDKHFMRAKFYDVLGSGPPSSLNPPVQDPRSC